MFFQRLDSQADSRCSWICSWRAASPEFHLNFRREKDFDVNRGFTSLCRPRVSVHSGSFPRYLSVTFHQKTTRNVTAALHIHVEKKRKEEWAALCVVAHHWWHSRQFFHQRDESLVKTTIIKITAEHTLVIWRLTASSKLSWWTVSLKPGPRNHLQNPVTTSMKINGIITQSPSCISWSGIHFSSREWKRLHGLRSDSADRMRGKHC